MRAAALLSLLCLTTSALAAPLLRRSPPPLEGSPDPTESSDRSCNTIDGCEPCRHLGELITWTQLRYPDEQVRLQGDDLLSADMCIVTIPFSQSESIQTMKTILQTAEFISHQMFSKDPAFAAKHNFKPADIMAQLHEIEDKVNSATDTYTTHFEWENDLTNAFASLRDDHTQFMGPLTTTFIWRRPRIIALQSVSVNGKPPEIYTEWDLNHYADNLEDAPTVLEIEGDDAFEYLRRDASLNLSPSKDTAWNLMFRDPQTGAVGRFIQPLYYPGQTTSIMFSNGSDPEYDNYAIVNAGDWSNVGGLKSAYDGLVRRVDDKSYATAADDPPTMPESNDVPTTSRLLRRKDEEADALHEVIRRNETPDGLKLIKKHSDMAKYPIAGYIMQTTPGSPDQQIAILQYGSFSDDTWKTVRVVESTLAKCKRESIRRLVIDMRTNYGGLVTTQARTFARLFPGVEVEDIGRFRGHRAAELIAMSYDIGGSPRATEYFLDYRTVKDTLGERFNYWDEYYDLTTINGEEYSRPAAYDIDLENDRPNAQFSAVNIVVISDGICSSACTSMLRWMVDTRGKSSVHVVTVGGDPQHTGPMISTGGSGGALVMTMKEIINLADGAKPFLKNQPDADAVLPSMPPLKVYDTTINMLDAFDDWASTDPQEFTPLWSECTLWYRWEHWKNPATLYQDVYDVIWGGDREDGTDPLDMCIEGSMMPFVSD